MKFLKRLLCKHNLEFARNIYGDEIIESGGNRSRWRCGHCGKVEYRSELRGEVKP